MGLVRFLFAVFILIISSTAAAHPVVIMLDIDDTVIKEANIHYHRNHPETQEIIYKPSQKKFSYFLNQVEKEGGGEKGTVPHYEIVPKTGIRSLVIPRPSVQHLLQKWAPFIQSGALQVYATSSNDEPRTLAVLKKVRFGSKTLNEWGVIHVPKSGFREPKGKGKSFSRFRTMQEISSESRVIAIDDIPDQYSGIGKNDQVIRVPRWDNDIAEPYLFRKKDFQNTVLQDYASILHVADTVVAIARRESLRNDNSSLPFCNDLFKTLFPSSILTLRK